MDHLTTRGITWDRNDHRRGYTLLETLLAMVVLGIIVGSVSAPLRGLALRSRLSRSTTTVSSDLARAFSLAERSQRPVRLRCDETQSALIIEDRDSGTVLFQRSFGRDGDYRLSSMSFSPASVAVFPNGLASAPLRIVLANGEFTRTLQVTRAGQVWELTP